MKVWAVCLGEYSDYRLKAVFSTEEKAYDWARGQAKDCIEVLPFEVDAEPIVELAGMVQFRVQLAMEDNGSIFQSHAWVPDGRPHAESEQWWRGYGYMVNGKNVGKVVYETFCSAMTETHACKIAMERLAIFKLNNPFPEPHK